MKTKNLSINIREEKLNNFYICLTSYHLFLAFSIINMLQLNSKHYIINLTKLSILSQNNIEIINIRNNYKHILVKLWYRIKYNKIYFKHTKLGKILNKKKYKNLYVFNDVEFITASCIDYNNFDNISLIEEGLALYNNKYETPKNLCLKKFFYYLIGSNLIQGKMGDNPKIKIIYTFNASQLKKVRGQCQKKIIELKRNKIFNYQNIRNFCRVLNFNENKNVRGNILILAQAFSENGKLNKFEKKYYEEILLIMQDINNIYIKPHPRDSKNKYKIFKTKNVKVLNDKMSDIPIECLINLFDFKLIITFSSSAILNIKHIFPNQDCCSLILMDNLDDPRIVNRFNKDIAKVYKEYNIFLPKNKEDLIRYLEELNLYAR